MSNQKRKPMSFIKWIINVNLFSIILAGVLMSIMCGIFISKRTNTDYQDIARTSCIHVAELLNSLTEDDFKYDAEKQTLTKGNFPITEDVFNNIKKAEEGINHTIFWGNERVISNIKDDTGKSVVGTTLTDSSIIDIVKKDGYYTASNIDIYGNKFSVCYYPLYNGNEMVAMVFAGVNQGEVNFLVIRDVITAVVIAFIIAIVISLLIIYMITSKTKVFGINLSNASSLAESKQETVNNLGISTNDNMQQINLAIEQVAQAVTQQASHTEEIMGNMEEFGSSIDIIMNQVENTSDLAKESINLIDELKTQLNELEEVSAENNNDIISISKQIQEDSNAVSNISQIIDVINDIAFQITILSFNASVEAARAGEAGKGFAVVAGSIKELSDKTKESLEQITGIVESVNEKMISTSNSSNELIEKNNKVIETLADTRARINVVVDSFDSIIESVDKISAESDTIIASKNQVVETVSSLAAASEENAAMSEEIKATSDEVITSTQTLLNEIDRLSDIVDTIDTVKNLFSEKLVSST